ncbi:HEAT repeat domain-containing protein [Spirosoma radiotolerans]|uniref:Anti-ECFsigma factor, ChrR n=1 Tax=Spirosoma radiotolerans TaxID=1379870 RepID=A0A0E3ZUX6_9BACT|nr:HEAT repeat domain-containing protein [Spirosoma radiotolerans]AKD54699.1 anti-ECFsigma factor, ChrR [Spirosoma radiotolerans]
MKQDIEKLLERYYDGETSLAEEKQLRQFFQQDNIPAHLEKHAHQFRYFVDARNQHPSLAFTNQLAAKLNPPEVSQFGRLTTWGLRLAASVTLLILGFAGGIVYNNWRADQINTQVADSAPALEMKKVLAFEQLPKTSASERIQAVNQSYELSQADQAITQLLINTLNFDANVNVRLAACQALARFENEPDVRDALIQSLRVQTDPNIQITLIEILVAIKEKRAVIEMKRLAQNQQLLDVVRLKAKEGINRLSRTQNSPS